MDLCSKANESVFPMRPIAHAMQSMINKQHRMTSAMTLSFGAVPCCHDKFIITNIYIFVGELHRTKVDHYRTRRKFSPNDSYYIKRSKYEHGPWIL